MSTTSLSRIHMGKKNAAAAASIGGDIGGATWAKTLSGVLYSIACSAYLSFFKYTCAKKTVMRRIFDHRW